ncbi:hypothetical protein J4217_04310 [Candidatus Pacearchaeota archaeon]|nr:hypothetical protein [Candidatus Pacearchaeota archaeon]
MAKKKVKKLYVKRINRRDIERRLNVNSSRKSKLLRYIMWSLVIIVVLLLIFLILKKMTGNVSLNIELNREPAIVRWFKAFKS